MSLLFTLLLACSGSDTDPALQTLIDEVLVPSGLTEDAVAVHQVGTLPKGARVDANDALGPVLVDGPTTLFQLDFQPDARWGHAVTWAFVDDDDTVWTEERTFYPVVDGEPFVPEWHAAVWGTAADPYDPADFDEPHELEDWDLGESGRRRSGGPDCPEKPSAVVTVAGGRLRSSTADARQWGRLLMNHDYAWQEVTPTRDQLRVDSTDVEAAVERALADGPLDELVIVYSGHGEPGTGHWLFGETVRNTHDELGVLELRDLLKDAEVDRLVLVLLQCHSGYLASDITRALDEAGMDDTEVIVHAAAEGGTEAFVEKVRPWGSAYGRRLHGTVAATPPEDEIDWRAISAQPFEVVTRIGTKTQQPTVVFKDAKVPHIMLDTYPGTRRCLAAWLDRGDTADDFMPSNDYTRGTFVQGWGFGDEVGHLELQDPEGNWVYIEPTFWSEDRITFHLPMRSDGYPANEGSLDTFERLTDAGLLAPPDEPEPGTYLLRVVRADGAESATWPVELEYQVYESLWVPGGLPGDDFPDWMEIWHPLTPGSDHTGGALIRLSRTWNATREASPIPDDLTVLTGEIDAQHETSPLVVGLGNWQYQRQPGIRDGQAENQAYPDDTFWGFHVDFLDDEVDPDTWGFTLIYD